MQVKYLQIIKAYACFLEEQTKTQAIIVPSEVRSEKFHIELNLLPHPVIVGNGRVRVRIRATVFAEIPASDKAIDDCINKSIVLATFFDEAQGFKIKEGVYAMAHHSTLRDDDDLFCDLGEKERSYSYNESWLVELEFNLEQI